MHDKAMSALAMAYRRAIAVHHAVGMHSSAQSYLVHQTRQLSPLMSSAVPALRCYSTRSPLTLWSRTYTPAAVRTSSLACGHPHLWSDGMKCSSSPARWFSSSSGSPRQGEGQGQQGAATSAGPSSRDSDNSTGRADPVRGPPAEDQAAAAAARAASRQQAREEAERVKQARLKNLLIYAVATAIACFGFSYAAVPLYRLFCQTTGFGGTTQKAHDGSRLQKLTSEESEPHKKRTVLVRFNADVAGKLPWEFIPSQSHLTVNVGEATLAFFTARNLSDRPIIGVAAYNVTPTESGLYFTKIQCFCFDEQRLEPGEEVDMPVFFFIDPDFDADWRMAQVTEITLSYTFFPSTGGMYDSEEDSAAATAAIAAVATPPGSPPQLVPAKA